MNKSARLAELRHFMARYGLPPERTPIPLGEPSADAVLGGGLKPGALHEVLAKGWSAGGFAVTLALLAAGRFFDGKGGPLFWVRSDYEALEYGALSPNGLAELGGDPRQLVLVRTRNPAESLSAAADILACPHVGALLLEIHGAPKCLDLVASRRLAFAAGESGATPILLRNGAESEPSAALTRWQVASAPSASFDDDWGNPVFDAQLIRHRTGGLGRFLLKWNPEVSMFVDPLPSQLGSAYADTSLRSHADATHPPLQMLRMRGRRA
ncbi:MAG TPA: hypothetical protein VIG39_09990 [Rhizomicrobium sp.]